MTPVGEGHLYPNLFEVFFRNKILKVNKMNINCWPGKKHIFKIQFQQEKTSQVLFKPNSITFTVLNNASQLSLWIWEYVHPYGTNWQI